MSKRYKPGDNTILARDLNRFGQAADRVLSNAPPAPSRTPAANPATVLVKNNSGSSVDRFGVLGIDGIEITQADNASEFYRRPLFSGAAPLIGTHDNNFAIALDAIPSGEIGRAFVSGIAQVKISMMETWHKFADIEHNAPDRLVSRQAGSARILWVASTTGIQWAIVRLCDGPKLYETIPVALTEDGTGSDGTASTAATWSYNVDDIDGNRIASIDPTAAPHNLTREKGKVTAATRGQGYYQPHPTAPGLWQFVLWWLDEQYTAGVC